MSNLKIFSSPKRLIPIFYSNNKNRPVIIQSAAAEETQRRQEAETELERLRAQLANH